MLKNPIVNKVLKAITFELLFLALLTIAIHILTIK